MTDRGYLSPFRDRLHKAVADLGGLCNAHLHLDRAGTIHPRYMEHADMGTIDPGHAPLAGKHGMISLLHGGRAYDPDDLRKRIHLCLDLMAEAGTSRAATFVDVTPDRIGLSALEIALEIKRQRSSDIRLEVGVYSPAGYRDSEPGRWDLLARGAALADFIGALPERDDTADYPSHIGFRESCRRVLLLGQERRKPVHLQVDQRNDPSETGAETVLQTVRDLRLHAISPSAYDDARFFALTAGLADRNIGVICCPSAALSMLQLRPVQTPTFNSIARVLEMLAAGVSVRIGSDNIADIFSPAGTPDLLDEVIVLSNALRFYRVDILAKLAAGVALSPEDREGIRQHLETARSDIARVLRRPRPAST